MGVYFGAGEVFDGAKDFIAAFRGEIFGGRKWSGGPGVNEDLDTSEDEVPGLLAAGDSAELVGSLKVLWIVDVVNAVSCKVSLGRRVAILGGAF